MKVFVVNCGSSSIKYQLFDMRDESVLAKGLLERVGAGSAVLHHKTGRVTHDSPVDAPNHAAGLKVILAALVDPRIGVIRSIDEIDGVGHRVVHGGEEITASGRIDATVLEVIRKYSDLAPLHNPPNLAGIEAATAGIPHAPQVAVFDTAFLSTLPPKAYRYAVLGEWYSRFHVRKYGFHGTSHRYVTLRAAELLGKGPDQVDLITCHLGNGCSMTAVASGKAVDHSMGMTPLEGLVMGTRSGDLDPAVPLYMISRGMSAAQVDRALNTSSGLLGLSGLSNDMRDLLAAADKGDKNARLALEIFVYRIVKYIGAYHAILPDLDAVVLTGGIGENSAPVRRMIVDGLGRLGAVADPVRNEATVGGKTGPITSDGSAPAVWVVPTNEELMIARDTCRIVAAGRSARPE
jgi:acetate kinase